MMFVLLSPKNRTVYNFRGNLIKEIISRGYSVTVTGPNLVDVDKIQALGANFRVIENDKNGMNPLADLKYMLALYRLFKELKPSAILGYTIKPVIYGAMAARMAGIRNINVMITGVGYAFTASSPKARFVKAITSMLYRIALKCAHKVIFQNPDNLQLFVEQGLVDPLKCHVVNGSGVDTAHFALAPLPQKLTFFMLARVMYSKGVREYLAAAEQLKKKYPHVTFMLLGAVENIQDSLSMEQLEPYIRSGVIEYYGETSDVREYYKKASVFVLPSYAEGTPRTVLEAMSMGRPIITTDAPGCRETVQDGVSGYLVPVKDSKALAERMEAFIKNPQLIEQMGARSRAYAEEKYDVRKVNEAMLKVMEIL